MKNQQPKQQSTTKINTNLNRNIQSNTNTPTKQLSVKPNLAKTNLEKTNLEKTNLAKVNLAKTNLAKTNLAKTNLAKPTSVKSLLQDIRKSVPLDSVADSYSITIGETVDTETTDVSSDMPKVSQGVKTKSSRLANRNSSSKK